MTDNQDIYQIINSKPNANYDPFLELYVRLVNAPKSMANTPNVWQSVDERGWSDEAENSFAVSQLYVNDPELYRVEAIGFGARKCHGG